MHLLSFSKIVFLILLISCELNKSGSLVQEGRGTYEQNVIDDSLKSPPSEEQKPGENDCVQALGTNFYISGSLAEFAAQNPPHHFEILINGYFLGKDPEYQFTNRGVLLRFDTTIPDNPNGVFESVILKMHYKKGDQERMMIENYTDIDYTEQQPGCVPLEISIELEGGKDRGNVGIPFSIQNHNIEVLDSIDLKEEHDCQKTE
jgi:hypothetical protein